MTVLTGLSAAGGKEKVLPGLWQEIPAAIEHAVGHGATANMRPFFAAAFIFSIIGILLLVMILSRAVDIQLLYFGALASFALSLVWLVCAVMSLLPSSFMGLHRVFIILVVAGTLASLFFRGGTLLYYWRERFYGDLTLQIVFIGTYYLAFAWLPLKFALAGR